MCRDYLSSYDFWLQRRSSLESGRLTEQLLPPDVLRNVLSRNIPDGAQPSADFLVLPYVTSPTSDCWCYVGV